MKILSIDWDYFINCSASDRIMKFPDGGNERLGSAMSTYVWGTRYGVCPEIKDIKVRSKELDILKKVIDRNQNKYLYVSADSHKHLGDFILQPDMEKAIKKEGLTIINIDHHSDYYNIGTELNCGNWLNKVMEKYPETKVTWIKNEDSDDEDFPFEVTADINRAYKETYDVIYLCRSGVWSPPHLDKEFGVLNRFASKRCDLPLLREQIVNRWDSEFIKDIEQSKQLSELVKANFLKTLAENNLQ